MPPPPPFGRSPSPASRGRISNIVLAARSRPSFAKWRIVSGDIANSAVADAPFATRHLLFAKPGFRFVPSGLRIKTKGSGTPKDAYVQPLHPAGAARAWRSALACRRSATALTRRALAHWARLQARLPGTWQERAILEKLHPIGGEGPRAVTRALPAPACPSPVAAPHAPAVVPASMMPGAAPARVATPRGSTALAPHSGSQAETRP
jgi:hypothetical protein